MNWYNLKNQKLFRPHGGRNNFWFWVLIMLIYLFIQRFWIPVRIHCAEAVRSKLVGLDWSEQDIADAVDWVLSHGRSRLKIQRKF
ncbi:MAG: hypothetical protein AUK48_14565 [Oscillatoriales cyanobacterium CG2_30_44_21]|nr:MAG: hypothetical protein AUK48_14565 [Oscillatoriales cyanobacterium CG2_30_44_21]